MSEPIPANTTDYSALVAQLDEYDDTERAFMALAVTHPEAIKSVYLWKPGGSA